jgi:hypothetical protein
MTGQPGYFFQILDYINSFKNQYSIVISSNYIDYFRISLLDQFIKVPLIINDRFRYRNLKTLLQRKFVDLTLLW